MEKIKFDELKDYFRKYDFNDISENSDEKINSYISGIAYWSQGLFNKQLNYDDAVLKFKDWFSSIESKDILDSRFVALYQRCPLLGKFYTGIVRALTDSLIESKSKQITNTKQFDDDCRVEILDNKLNVLSKLK